MKILTGILIFLAVLWTGAWFAISSWLNGTIADAFEQQREKGMEINCVDQGMRGFPFNMGLGCGSVSVAQPDGSKIDFGALRTAASLTSPGEAHAEIDGPLTIQAGGSEVKADWTSLKTFIDLTFDGGFDIATFSFADLKLNTGPALFEAGNGNALLQPQATSGETPQARHLETRVSVGGLKAEIPGTVSITPFTLDFDAMLEDGYQDLFIKQVPADELFTDGAKGSIRKAAIILPEGGKLVLSGPLELGTDGLLSGTMKVGLANPEQITAWARSISPALEQPMSLLTQSIAGMGAANIIAGEDVRSIELTIDRGEVRLGFIKLTDIPPLN